ncbi:MAG: DNA recombination protein RmuC [Negativicutes bacterium]|nr:DNA recombination protein RmuC [Negativicutes bacterium]
MPDMFVWLSLGLNMLTVVILAVILSRGRSGREAQALALAWEKGQEKLERIVKEQIAENRRENSDSLRFFNDSVLARMADIASLQARQLDSFSQQLLALTQSNDQKLDRLRETVAEQLKLLQADNHKQLEQMRATVDEKLHATLEKRLGESFKQVSERLELVHKGLGEMQSLASGVGDLKRVLTNVKTRGIWGEIHLGNLLEQILTLDQYAQNVATKKGSNDRVEYAVKLPGRDKAEGVVWLPIDAKFPQEDYQRLLDAQDQANAVMAEEAAKSLEGRVKAEAKNICEKYLDPPHTTDFAILFLPVEGLYAEVLRRPGLSEVLQRQYRVIVTGPTTLAALLSSLQMGFKTLAVEKRSSEVWALLGAVKTEFGRFGEMLDKTQKKLQEASNAIETAAQKSRTIERKLKTVQELPASDAVALLDE